MRIACGMPISLDAFVGLVHVSLIRDIEKQYKNKRLSKALCGGDANRQRLAAQEQAF